MLQVLHFRVENLVKMFYQKSLIFMEKPLVDLIKNDQDNIRFSTSNKFSIFVLF